jgi:manganese transport protein
VAVDHTPGDAHVLAHAESLAKAHGGASLVLLHVTETAGAHWYADQAHDREARGDAEYLSGLADALTARGLSVETRQGFGGPPGELARLAREAGVDALIVGGHGHRFLLNLLTGSTVGPLRSSVPIPVIAVGTVPVLPSAAAAEPAKG